MNLGDKNCGPDAGESNRFKPEPINVITAKVSKCCTYSEDDCSCNDERCSIPIHALRLVQPITPRTLDFAGFWRYSSASSKVETAMTEIPLTSVGRSSQFSRAAKSTVAPARFAAMIFSVIPPIGPTLPAAVMVPDAAIFLPCSKSVGVSNSVRPSANISPPLGPPVFFSEMLRAPSTNSDVSTSGNFLCSSDLVAATAVF